MSEIKVNKIQPAAGDRIVVAAPIQGADAPSDCPDCLATLRQVGGGMAGAPTISSTVYTDEQASAALTSAKQYSDEQNELQNAQIALDISAAKTEAITTSNQYSDTQDGVTLSNAQLYSDSIALGVGQTWNVLNLSNNSRISSTILTSGVTEYTVTNPFGRPIMVAISIDNTYNAVIKVDGVSVFSQSVSLSLYTETWDELGLPYPSISSTFIVPADSTYSFTVGGSATITSLAELT
jgi:hypothetical protein